MGRRRYAVGIRTGVFLGILAAAVAAAASLGLFTRSPLPGKAGLAAAGEFFSRAFSPSFVSEAPPPFGGGSILPSLLTAVYRTVLYGVAALLLAVVLGSALAYLGSTARFSGRREGARTRVGRVVRRLLGPGIYVGTRVVIALLRSTHELIWAVLFLCALGRSDLSAVVAIAIPYAGTMAKVFAEMLDEAPRDAAQALRAAGATEPAAFLFGLLPRAIPDMTAYAFYQLECALRASAVMGFFGYGTLGYSISASFENLYYGEVWAYLYALAGLILLAEWWSGAVRRRILG